MYERGPRPVTERVFGLSARTTHASSRTFYPVAAGARNLRFDLDVDAFSGTSITFTIQWYDAAAGEWRTLLASAAISGTGPVSYTVGPDLATVANVSLQAVLPERVRVTPSGTITSVTYSGQFTYGS